LQHIEQKNNKVSNMKNHQTKLLWSGVIIVALALSSPRSVTACDQEPTGFYHAGCPHCQTIDITGANGFCDTGNRVCAFNHHDPAINVDVFLTNGTCETGQCVGVPESDVWTVEDSLIGAPCIT